MSLVAFRARNHPQQPTRDDVDDRRTPLEFWLPLHEAHDFTVDAAASAENAVLPRYWTRETDGLRQWWAGERVWCNPPYSNIRPWVEKAWQSMVAAELIVMLLPANRTEQKWWQELVEPHRDNCHGLRVEFLPGRPRFVAPDKPGIGPNERPPFGCCLLIWKANS
jgi:phage N-6-adenine-methyltransferase